MIRGRRPPRHQSDAPALVLPAPRGLAAYTFEVDGDAYALLAFELPAPNLPAGLSFAEQQVALGVVEGKTNAQIGQERGTSANTVANQLRSVFAKLRISSRLELVERCTTRHDGRP
jgi:DNA-binding NarL/FixJ family response regulator